MEAKDVTLYSGGARGAEAAFGAAAAAHGLREVNFTFDGHHIERTAGARKLTTAELNKSDVVMEEVSKRLHRDYSKSPWMRQILQSIWYQINNGYQVFVIGTIQADGTVKGGTGWAVELAKLYNRPLFVYDQERGDWFTWRENTWVSAAPTISHITICGTGTRHLNAAGAAAIEALFANSFGK